MSFQHTNRKLLITLLVSILAPIALIAHGVYFDADISQLKRITLEGFILTFVITFPALLFLEWMFDLNNKVEFKQLEARVRKLEQKRK